MSEVESVMSLEVDITPQRLEQFQRDHQAGRLVHLMLDHNNCAVREPCNLCGQDHKPDVGLIPALPLDSHLYVCDECAARHDPFLWACSQFYLEKESANEDAALLKAIAGRFQNRQELIRSGKLRGDPKIFLQALYAGLQTKGSAGRDERLKRACAQYHELRRDIRSMGGAGSSEAMREGCDLDQFDLWRWIEEQVPITVEGAALRAGIMSLQDFPKTVPRNDESWWANEDGCRLPF